MANERSSAIMAATWPVPEPFNPSSRSHASKMVEALADFLWDEAGEPENLLSMVFLLPGLEVPEPGLGMALLVSRGATELILAVDASGRGWLIYRAARSEIGSLRPIEGGDCVGALATLCRAVLAAGAPQADQDNRRQH